MSAEIFVMQGEGGSEILVSPVGPGMERGSLGALWDELENIRSHGYVVCSMCSRAVAKDARGDVLDSSGRCDECRP